MTRLADLIFKKGYKIEQDMTTTFTVRCPHHPHIAWESTSDFNRAYNVMRLHAKSFHDESVGDKNEPTNKG